MKKGFQFPRINGREVGDTFSMPVYRGAIRISLRYMLMTRCQRVVLFAKLGIMN